MQELATSSIACEKCSHVLSLNVRYCPNCGNSQLDESKLNWRKFLWPILLYYFIILGEILSFHFIDFEKTIDYVVWHDVLFSTITLIFALCYFKSFKASLNIRKVKVWYVLLIVLGSIAFAFLVYFSIHLLNNSAYGNEDKEIDLWYHHSAYPLLYGILFTAVQPALFEEIAFRGFIFKNLTEMTNATAAILVSACMFGILHLSFMSLIWLIPAGIIYAVFRHKSGVLWYGIVAHFTHNCTVVLIEFYEHGELVKYFE